MRMSFDNQVLFSVGNDGNIFIYDVRDRDTKGPAIKREFEHVKKFSQEILVDKSEMEEFINTRDGLETEVTQS